MNKALIATILLAIFTGIACAKEKLPAPTPTENAKAPEKPLDNTDNSKTETSSKQALDHIIIDYKDFPKDENGQEIWTKKVKTGKPDVKVVEDKELKTNVLNLKSDEASYFFQKEVENIDLDTHGTVSWKWKVTQNPKGGDVRKGRTDDQAIQVLLAFEGKYIISYIWDPSAPVGYSKDSSIPFIVAQKIMVLESGDKNLNKWLEIRRDIKADFKKLYNKDAPKLKGVAIQINSQHTDSKCESFLSPIKFEAEQ